MELKKIYQAFHDMGIAYYHSLIFGMTGSGKTENAIKPTIAEVALKQCPALIVDPKKELEMFLDNLFKGIPNRLIKLDGTDFKVNPFTFEKGLSLKQKILSQYRTIDGVRVTDNGHNGSFAGRAEVQLCDFMDLAELYYQNRGRNIFADSFYLSQVITKGYNQSSYKRKRSKENRDVLEESSNDFDIEDISNSKKLKIFLEKNPIKQGFFQAFKAYVDYSLSGSKPNIHEICYELGVEAGVSEFKLGFLNSLKNAAPNSTGRATFDNWFYSTVYINMYLDLVLDETVNQYLELEPLEINDSSITNHWDENRIILLVMDPAKNDDKGFDFVVKQIKSFYFKYAFKRKDKTKRLYYICDEFHRFFTMDRATGEQNFLDRCRSENVTCVLATQSIQSLVNAAELQSNGGAINAVEILLNNAPNLYFFGTKDIRTQQYINELVPHPPGMNLPKVSQARPLSTLDIGEAYIFKQNGDWDIQQFDLSKVRGMNESVKQILPEIYKPDCSMVMV